jgi:hypothetical protein
VGRVVDPDSMGSMDPYPDTQSGSRRAKIIPKHRNKFMNFIFASAGCSLLSSKGFSCSLDVRYGDLGIRNLQVLL